MTSIPGLERPNCGLVDSHVRATMLSLQSVLARLVLSAVLAVLGVATAHLGLPTTLALAAGVVAIAGGTLLVLAWPARRQ